MPAPYINLRLSKGHFSLPLEIRTQIYDYIHISSTRIFITQESSRPNRKSINLSILRPYKAIRSDELPRLLSQNTFWMSGPHHFLLWLTNIAPIYVKYLESLGLYISDSSDPGASWHTLLQTLACDATRVQHYLCLSG